jgi:predicted regulator of Ras-like GTPase activity (Roadblock/LC7/MglB family)
MSVKQNIAKTQSHADAASILTVGEDNSVFTNLSGTLSEIRKLKGVLGYILRNKTAAIIDLTQKEAIIEYAMLSSQVHDCRHGIAKQFNLADVESVLVEGKSVKVLCMGIGENKISVFMDKTCAHAWIAKRILL